MKFKDFLNEQLINTSIHPLVSYPPWFVIGLETGEIRVKNLVIDLKDGRILIVKAGTWESGIWEGGEWSDGIWEDGIWNGGVWHQGWWKSGLFVNGIWEDGVWSNGTFRRGKWLDGEWRNGVFKKGMWHGGIWYGGAAMEGSWETGSRWTRGYIHYNKKLYVSDVNPKIFFERIKKGMTPDEARKI